MVRQRVRIHFGKQDDLRWISHRDLVRVFERLFRRAGLRLGMSEGFHPKARMSFPSALALGVEGCGEVMELELAERMEAGDLHARLRELAPPGLRIDEVEMLADGTKKAQAVAQTYEFAVPPERRATVREAIRDVMAQSSLPLRRDAAEKSVDVRAGLEQLELTDGKLRMRLAMSRQADVHPRDVLRLLALDDLERDGYGLTRTSLELR